VEFDLSAVEVQVGEILKPLLKLTIIINIITIIMDLQKLNLLGKVITTIIDTPTRQPLLINIQSTSMRRGLDLNLMVLLLLRKKCNLDLLKKTRGRKSLWSEKGKERGDLEWEVRVAWVSEIILLVADKLKMKGIMLDILFTINSNFRPLLYR